MMKWLIGGWLLGAVFFLAFLWRAADGRSVPARATTILVSTIGALFVAPFAKRLALVPHVEGSR